MSDRIRHINRVARDMAYNRRRQQIVKPKKGKGSYERQNEKEIARSQAESHMAKRTPDAS